MKLSELEKIIFSKIDISPTFIQITLIIAFLILLISVFMIGKLTEKVKSISRIKNNRNDAIKRSRAVLNGQITEQIAPFLPDFPCDAGDVRFVGKPVDFIAFPGMSEGKEIKEVLLIEVKTGSSKLSSREKEIKELIEKGKVRYMEYYFSADK